VASDDVTKAPATVEEIVERWADAWGNGLGVDDCIRSAVTDALELVARELETTGPGYLTARDHVRSLVSAAGEVKNGV